MSVIVKNEPVSGDDTDDEPMDAFIEQRDVAGSSSGNLALSKELKEFFLKYGKCLPKLKKTFKKLQSALSPNFHENHLSTAENRYQNFVKFVGNHFLY